MEQNTTKVKFFRLLAISLLAIISFGFFFRRNIVFPSYAIEMKQHTKAIYLDRFGKYYPPLPLGTFNKRKNYARLSTHFIKNKELWYPTIDQLSLSRSVSFEDLQNKIIETKATEISDYIDKNSLKSVTFIMNGFNNYYDSKGTDPTSSNVKLDNLIDKINTRRDPTTLFVKVYWDGKYAKGMPGTMKNFSYATTNSYYCGYELRKLIQKITCKNINFISHSLGANIICEAIFNQRAKTTNRDGFQESLDRLQKITSVFVTGKNIKVAMIAPAMPGTTTFTDYFNHALNPSVQHSNISFLIGYNTNDQVLKKFVRKFSSYFGSTTLGSDPAEVANTKNLFDSNRLSDKYFTVDFSDNAIRSGPPSHDLQTYLNNTAKYNEVIDFLYK